MLSASFDHDAVLTRLKDGDEGALALLYNRYWDGLMRSCYKTVKDTEECKDIVQDVFILVWDKRSIISINRDIGSYLFGVLRYKVFDYLRVNHRKLKAFDEMVLILEDLASAAENPEKLLEYEEVYKSVLDIVAALPDRCKLIYEMREDGMSYKDIASKLDVSVKTVENQLLKARRQLKFSLRQFFLITVIALITVWHLLP